MKNEIENIIDIKLNDDTQGGYYIPLSKWVAVPFEKKLQIYMYCRENGIRVFLDYQNKNKCFRKEGVE